MKKKNLTISIDKYIEKRDGTGLCWTFCHLNAMKSLSYELNVKGAEWRFFIFPKDTEEYCGPDI